MTKRGSELVVQTLAAINVRRWSFLAVGSFSVVGDLAAVGGHSAGGSMEGSTFGIRIRTSSGNSRSCGTANCCRGAAETVPGVRAVAEPGLRAPLCKVCIEATWRQGSSICSSSRAGLSGVEGEMLAVVGRGVTSQILSAWWEVESRLPSVWPTRRAWTCGGSRLAQMGGRKSSGTSGARLLKCRRNVMASGRPFPHVKGDVSRAVCTHRSGSGYIKG